MDLAPEIRCLKTQGAQTLRSTLALMKSTIPLPAIILIKLSINTCAQMKVNIGMLCFINIYNKCSASEH